MTTLIAKSKPAPTVQLKAKQRQLTQVLTLRPVNAAVSVLPQRTLAVFQPKPEALIEPLRPLPQAKKFAVQRTAGWISRIAGQDLVTGSRIEIEVPLGSPRHISAATLKRMLKGKRSDQLLKKTGATWSICPDDLRIDLADTKTQFRFRLGQIAVYS
jgi:hypothetical protein